MTRQGLVSASVYIKHTYATSLTNTHTKSRPLGKVAPFAIKLKHIVDTLTCTNIYPSRFFSKTSKEERALLRQVYLTLIQSWIRAQGRCLVR